MFLRRVNSRILYEQMLGRATRLCPEIGKETFRIFDAVDLYDKLENLTDMKPVAADPSLTLAQLLEELERVEDAEHRAAVRDQIIVKMSRCLKRLAPEARARFELQAGEPPETTLAWFRLSDADAMATWAKSMPGVGPLLDWTTAGSTPRMIPISEHADEVISVTRGYGAAQRPEDFLDAFGAFVRGNLNHIPALMLAVQRPRDLTREQLRQLRLRLDAEGFSDANIRRAWADTKNEDIAASIIGYVRQAALGDPLVPYRERVSRAVDAIIRRGGWTDVQKKWLHRIGEQLEKEVVVDVASLDQEPFRADGGFRVLNKRFDGKVRHQIYPNRCACTRATANRGARPSRQIGSSKRLSLGRETAACEHLRTAPDISVKPTLVRLKGLEPPRLSATEPKSVASTNSATAA